MSDCRLRWKISIDNDLYPSDYDYQDVQAALQVLSAAIPSVYEHSREASLAITKLDECEMWLERATIRE